MAGRQARARRRVHGHLPQVGTSRPTVIGEVTADDTLTMTWRGRHGRQDPAKDRRRRPGLPAAARPGRKNLDALAGCRPGKPGQARRYGPGLRETLLKLLGSPGLADKRWGHPAVRQPGARRHGASAMPEDGGLVRVSEESGPRHRARHRRQRQVLHARPVPGHSAGARGGLQERGDDGCRAGRRH